MQIRCRSRDVGHLPLPVVVGLVLVDEAALNSLVASSSCLYALPRAWKSPLCWAALIAASAAWMSLTALDMSGLPPPPPPGCPVVVDGLVVLGVVLPPPPVVPPPVAGVTPLRARLR